MNVFPPLSPVQKDVWDAIIDYILSDGDGYKRFYAAPDPQEIGSVLIAPKYGEGIRHSTLKDLERRGLIIVPDDYNNMFRLTPFGTDAIRASIDKRQQS